MKPLENYPVEGNSPSARTQQTPWGYILAACLVLLTTAVATPLQPYLDLANIVMLFLLPVVLIAVRYGRGPAVFSTFIGVAAFDFYFVSPRFSFAVNDIQYLITFAVMLTVGLLTAHLTSRLRYQAQVAENREASSRALYEFARELSGALQTDQITDIARNFIEKTFQAKVLLLMPDDANRLALPPLPEKQNAAEPRLSMLDMKIAQWAFEHAVPTGAGTNTLSSSPFSFFPLVAPVRARGVLAIYTHYGHAIPVADHAHVLNAFAALVAIALERVHYVEVAQDAVIHMESERLRNALLAALSHDLRTPLTSLVGLSESLAMSKPALTPEQLDLANALHDESLRMSSLVSNLLEMARIQEGKVSLNMQWQYFEEVVGSALRASRTILEKHEVRTALAPGLPLVSFDAVLVERVLCNLTENAAKYTPPGSRITIAASVDDSNLEVEVYDNGPGLPGGRENEVFEKFVRGERESPLPGVGLGLAMCRAIVEAHGGTIHAKTSPEGGACIIFTLPLRTPPTMPDMEEDNPN